MIILLCFAMLSLHSAERPLTPVASSHRHGFVRQFDASVSELSKKREWDHQGYSLDDSKASTYMSDDESSTSHGEVTYENGIPVTTVTWDANKQSTGWLQRFLMRIKDACRG